MRAYPCSRDIIHTTVPSRIVCNARIWVCFRARLGMLNDEGVFSRMFSENTMYSSYFAHSDMVVISQNFLPHWIKKGVGLLAPS
jgi:hypothetical protein